MGSNQKTNVNQITRHVVAMWLILTLAFISGSAAPGQGLKGDRGFGWPSPSELEDGEQLVKLNPRSYAASEELAEMYFFRGERRKSIELLRAAVKMRFDAHVAYSDPQGVANAYSWLGWNLLDEKQYAEAEIALKHSIDWWKHSMISDRTGNSQYRLELELEKLTECYAQWGKTDMARKMYVQFLRQMEVPNDGHDNPHDLNRQLEQLGILRNPACPKPKAKQFKARKSADVTKTGASELNQHNS